MSNKEIDKLLLMLLDDDSSFEKLYEQTRVIVFAYIMSLVKNYDDSKDILQETYIKIYKASSSYQSMSKPLAWIYTIARNECYLYLRRQTYTEEYQDNVVLPMYMDKDTQLILENLFEILNEKERQVIIMHSLWGFKHHEIAKLLEISISTSLSCYHRGMKKMKKEMGINL
jgi:RNA polymerase sigma factor, sigma-70 family